MQTCLAANRWDKQWIDKLIDESVLSHLPDLLKIGVGVEEATREVRLRARGLRVFSERYIAETPKVRALLIPSSIWWIISYLLVYSDPDKHSRNGTSVLHTCPHRIE